MANDATLGSPRAGKLQNGYIIPAGGGGVPKGGEVTMTILV